MVNILFVVTNHAQLGDTGKKTGWYLPELAHPYHFLMEKGHYITIASPKGGKAPLDPSSYEAFKEDPVCKAFYEDKKCMDLLEDTKQLKDMDPKNFNAIFFVGGHGPMWDLADCSDSHSLVSAIYENGGVASAVCHGSIGLANVKLSNGDYLVKGKKVTSFTNAEEDSIQLTPIMPCLPETELTKRGGVFVAADIWQCNVQVCDRLVTGQNPASATKCAEELHSILTAA